MLTADRPAIPVLPQTAAGGPPRARATSSAGSLGWGLAAPGSSRGAAAGTTVAGGRASRADDDVGDVGAGYPRAARRYGGGRLRGAGVVA